MDNTKRIKKIRALFVVNIVLAVILFISSIILCFVPTTGMVENSEWESSSLISAADMVFGNWEADLLVKGYHYGKTVNLYNLFPSGSVGPIHGTQGLIDAVFGFAVADIVLTISIFSIGLLVFCLSTKKKVRNGTLEIRKHFLKKTFDRPVYLFNYTSLAFTLIFSIPALITIALKDTSFQSDIYIAEYVLYVAIIYVVVLLLYPTIIQSIVKKELDYLSDEEMSEILPKFANYTNAVAIRKEIEARDKEEDNSEKIKKYYELYQQGIITEEEFNEKKKDILDSDK